ncbi:uncharacterized protein LOC107006202 [Solanum pennellii]|uniref:Uncharacterized protein LOC107006202 n=1 Tax=Solanum pennellii TaxID=28526 RepID=A0ABM1FQP1_SOLPN|nr:uncharacterized protein LOC107006202 [Solanum pennellii]
MHLQAVNKILQYLRGSPGKGILFKRGGDMVLEAYTDADYAGSLVDRRSSSGYCIFLGGNLVIYLFRHTSAQDVELNNPAYLQMPHSVDDNFLKITTEARITVSNIMFQISCKNMTAYNILHDLFQYGDSAQKYMQGSKNVEVHNVGI